MPSASVLDLPALAVANRLTLRDRMELDRWSDVARGRGAGRLVLHERLEGDPSEVGNYVAVYAGDGGWASWGLSRRLGGIVVWDSVSGADIGRFASMHEALSWVLEAIPGQRPAQACRRSVGQSCVPAPMPADRPPVRLGRGS